MQNLNLGQSEGRSNRNGTLESKESKKTTDPKKKESRVSCDIEYA